MPPRSALVLGASGNVGAKLVCSLALSRAFDQVIAVTRRPWVATQCPDLPITNWVVPNLVDFPLDSIHHELVGFSALGVGSNTAALTLEQHMDVDVKINLAFAQALKNSGKTKHFIFLSAVSASSDAYSFGPGFAGSPRYNHVKGKAEDAILSVGFEHVSIFRPATILGNSHTPGFIEKLIPALEFITPKNFISIHIDDLGKCMAVRGIVGPVPAPVEILHYPEMQEVLKQKM